MTSRDSSGLRSWPRMMPCSSPLSFDSAMAAARGAHMNFAFCWQLLRSPRGSAGCVCGKARAAAGSKTAFAEPPPPRPSPGTRAKAKLCLHNNVQPPGRAANNDCLPQLSQALRTGSLCNTTCFPKSDAATSEPLTPFRCVQSRASGCEVRSHFEHAFADTTTNGPAGSQTARPGDPLGNAVGGRDGPSHVAATRRRRKHLGHRLTACREL
jgi:hypothetical protein